MMKQFLINMLISSIMDMIIMALAELSRRSDNTVDDQAVKVISDNRDQIETMIRSKRG